MAGWGWGVRTEHLSRLILRCSPGHVLKDSNRSRQNTGQYLEELTVGLPPALLIQLSTKTCPVRAHPSMDGDSEKLHPWGSIPTGRRFYKRWSLLHSKCTAHPFLSLHEPCDSLSSLKVFLLGASICATDTRLST